MCKYKNIYLKSGKEESLLRFHPWIFSGAISKIEEGIEEGDIVRINKFNGDFIGIGHYQIGTISVRILSFLDIVIDHYFWEEKLRSAICVRQSLGIIRPKVSIGSENETVNDIYRLVHGEGDNLPGLIIDVYAKCCVIQAHSVGMHIARFDIANAIKSVMGDKIGSIYYKSETTLPFKANICQENYFLLGYTEDNIAKENGLKFYIDWLKGQKTGFFIDQRDNRMLLEKYAKGRNVLNMFSYTGGFSVYALRGGANMVHSVDSSAKAIEITEQNIILNFPNDTRHKSFCTDAFKYLDGVDKQYDLIVLDPPAFAKRRTALKNGLRGYIRLNLKGLEKIKSGGILFTFSCSQAVSKEQFRQAVFTAAMQAGRKVRILHQLHQPADHPINIYHLEGEYLKGLVLYVE